MRQQGFTLIELLLVLAIIGIITAIAIPALLGQREAARNKATISNASNIKSALVSAFGELDKPPVQRSLDLAAATSVGDVLTAVSLRSEFNPAIPGSSRNPFFRDLAGYRFNAGAPIRAGEVSLGPPAPNANTGEPEVAIGYGIMKKGVADLSPRLMSLDAAY